METRSAYRNGISPELNKVLISAHPLVVKRTPPTTTQFWFSNSRMRRKKMLVNLFSAKRLCDQLTVREEKFFRRVHDLAFQGQEHERYLLGRLRGNLAADEGD